MVAAIMETRAQANAEYRRTLFDELGKVKNSTMTAAAQIAPEQVMANIAEGFGRGTQNEFIQFLGYALGSLNETQSHLTAAYDRDYLAKEQNRSLVQLERMAGAV